MTRSLANKDEPGLAGKDRAASINLFPFSISLSPKQVSETTWWFGSCETWSRPANRVGPSARPSSLGPERERKKIRKTQRRAQKKIVAKGLDNEPTSKDRARRASGTNTWHCLDQTIVWRRGIKEKTNLSQQARGPPSTCWQSRDMQRLIGPQHRCCPPASRRRHVGKPIRVGWHPRGFRAIDWAKPSRHVHPTWFFGFGHAHCITALAHAIVIPPTADGQSPNGFPWGHANSTTTFHE